MTEPAGSKEGQEEARWHLLVTHYRGEAHCPDLDEEDDDNQILCWGCELRKTERALSARDARIRE